MSIHFYRYISSGIAEDATEDQIKRAYRKMAL